MQQQQQLIVRPPDSEPSTPRGSGAGGRPQAGSQLATRRRPEVLDLSDSKTHEGLQGHQRATARSAYRILAAFIAGRLLFCFSKAMDDIRIIWHSVRQGSAQKVHAELAHLKQQVAARTADLQRLQDAHSARCAEQVLCLLLLYDVSVMKARCTTQTFHCSPQPMNMFQCLMQPCFQRGHGGLWQW